MMMSLPARLSQVVGDLNEQRDGHTQKYRYTTYSFIVVKSATLEKQQREKKTDATYVQKQLL